MIKKIWVGMAVAMSCASVMASTIVGTDQLPITPAGGTLAAGGVIDNFDTQRNAGGWTYGDTVGGSIGETVSGSGNIVEAYDPGSSAGNYAFMYTDNKLGTIASALGVPLQPTSTPGPGGTVKTSSYISFNFSYVTSPSLVELFLTDGNGGAWYTTIALGTPGTWNSYLVWLDPARDTWYDKGHLPTGAQSTFAADIANIGNYYLGLNILYPDQQPDSYFVDSVDLGQWQWSETSSAVPEPGTMSMLGFALASMGLTFRRRLRSIFKG